jgi:hypothetical protein
MPGVGVFVSAGLERPALWSPSVLIGATHAWRSRVREEGGDASFMLDAASFDACPWRLQLAPIDVRPCASVLVGRFAVRGTRTQNAAPESARPFWVLGGAVLGSVKLVWLLEAQVRIAFGANLVRDSFEFAPVVFHRVGPASFTTSAGIGVHLP